MESRPIHIKNIGILHSKCSRLRHKTTWGLIWKPIFLVVIDRKHAINMHRKIYSINNVYNRRIPIYQHLNKFFVIATSGGYITLCTPLSFTANYQRERISINLSQRHLRHETHPHQFLICLNNEELCLVLIFFLLE